MTLTGSNSFTLQHALNEYVHSFVEQHGNLALERVDCQEASFEQIQQALTGLPFLASKKMVVLRTPSVQKKFIEAAEQLLESMPESTELILLEPKLDKRLSYYKLLKKNTDFHEFNELDQAGLAQWLVQTAKDQNGELSLQNARYLVERVGANQQVLASELEKLLLYDPKITRQTIDLLTEPLPQSSIFQLLETAFSGQPKKTMQLYAEQRAQKVEPQQIIAMLAWQLHGLAIIQAAGDRSVETIAKEAKLNPFVVRKSQGIARKVSHQELRQLIHDLLRIDTQTKTSAVDPDEALQHYFLKLSQ